MCPLLSHSSCGDRGRPPMRSSASVQQSDNRAMPQTSARRRSDRRPAAQTGLPDVIWEDIFLRLDTATDLVRAAAACSSFRDIVSKPQFLHSFRSLRSPAVLGFISSDRLQFVPVEPPHRSAPEARALDRAADFTFSYLPGDDAWDLRHARDGRVLLSRRMYRRMSYYTGVCFEGLVVCDPLHRRYVRIPRIPENLAAASPMPRFGPVLAPAGEDEEEGSFRVVRAVCFPPGRFVAFVFSSCKQEWQCITSTVSLPRSFGECVPYYAHGCIFWVDYRMGFSLMLDTSEMELSRIELPRHNRDSMFAIVEAEQGRLGFLIVGDGKIDLYCRDWQRNGGGAGAREWQHEKLIPLPKDSGINYHWEIEGTAGRYLALVAHRGVYDESTPSSEHFVLDIKTLLVEKLCTSNSGMFYGFPYTSFPPLLALPTI